MNETVASDDDGEPFVFTETFVAAVVGVCGVLVFCLPLNKLIHGQLDEHTYVFYEV